jgi:hypothetical protein
MIRGLILVSLALTPFSALHAAEKGGIVMPETRVADGTHLRLNGIGLRTYSIFGIHIYVAGLYLERQSDDPDSILHSPEKKLLDVRFVRDINAEDARQAWRDGLDRNCRMPACHLDPADVERFLSFVPSVHAGDKSSLFFTSTGVAVTFNERPIGDITDRRFAETMLATFIGPVPATAQLKRELLGDAH